MKIEKLGPWLLPTLLAPWLTMTALITAVVAVGYFFDQLDPKFSPGTTWGIGMLAGSIASGLISLTLIAVDLVKVKRGTLPPVGIHACAGGMVAFVVALGFYMLLLPVVDDGFLFGEALDFCMMVLGAIAVGAISARLVFFRRAKSG